MALFSWDPADPDDRLFRPSHEKFRKPLTAEERKRIEVEVGKIRDYEARKTAELDAVARKEGFTSWAMRAEQRLEEAVEKERRRQESLEKCHELHQSAREAAEIARALDPQRWTPIPYMAELECTNGCKGQSYFLDLSMPVLGQS